MVADLFHEWVGWYQRLHDPDFGLEHITEWDFHKCVPIGGEIYRLLNVDGLFENLPPIEGALEALREIHDSGKWKIVLASAPTQNPNSCAEKHRWREKHLPFLTRKDLWLGHHKWMLKADAILEDSPEQIADYRAKWPEAWIGSICYEYNRVVEDKVDCYAQSYKDFGAAWATLRQAVLGLQ